MKLSRKLLREMILEQLLKEQAPTSVSTTFLSSPVIADPYPLMPGPWDSGDSDQAVEAAVDEPALEEPEIEEEVDPDDFCQMDEDQRDAATDRILGDQGYIEVEWAQDLDWESYPIASDDIVRIVRGYSSGHQALDISANQWTYIYAIADGTVENIWMNTDSNGYGIRINHGRDLECIEHKSSYIHMAQSPRKEDSTRWAVGDTVVQGDVLGRVGTTAGPNSSVGAHLHFQIRQNGIRIDPDLLRPPASTDPETLEGDTGDTGVIEESRLLRGARRSQKENLLEQRIVTVSGGEVRDAKSIWRNDLQSKARQIHQKATAWPSDESGIIAVCNNASDDFIRILRLLEKAKAARCESTAFKSPRKFLEALFQEWVYRIRSPHPEWRLDSWRKVLPYEGSGIRTDINGRVQDELIPWLDSTAGLISADKAGVEYAFNRLYSYVDYDWGADAYGVAMSCNSRYVQDRLDTHDDGCSGGAYNSYVCSRVGPGVWETIDPTPVSSEPDTRGTIYLDASGRVRGQEPEAVETVPEDESCEAMLDLGYVDSCD
jgi:murein DD-endopeptidase MepM/ murein hydrolase activator NlpD